MSYRVSRSTKRHRLAPNIRVGTVRYSVLELDLLHPRDPQQGTSPRITNHKAHATTNNDQLPVRSKGEFSLYITKHIDWYCLCRKLCTR